eukprot:snap_masked-scaffold310_size212938-processed-gene-0.0 protein:Tk03972 transcript:snap_masked-scaffold310_size212938-processed-gene-0.0-mRNA-1 annotation:"hypothetical protein KGM_13179"
MATDNVQLPNSLIFWDHQLFKWSGIFGATPFVYHDRTMELTWASFRSIKYIVVTIITHLYLLYYGIGFFFTIFSDGFAASAQYFPWFLLVSMACGVVQSLFVHNQQFMQHFNRSSIHYENNAIRIKWNKLLEYSSFLPARLTSNAEIWFHVARSSIAAFCLYFMWMGIGCVTGLLGCWKANGDHLIPTAILVLLGSLCGSAGMGLWHWAKFYELEKVYDARLGFFLSWPEVLQEATAFTLGWSYILAWIGVGLSLISSLLFMASAVCLRVEMSEMEHNEMMLRLQLSYPTHSILKQPNGSASIPPTPMSRRSSIYSQNYFPVGYPLQDDLLKDPRSIQYKSVVKELEDSKV